jgi:hypothetical protein
MINTTKERADLIAGAKECVVALQCLLQSAKNLPDTADDAEVFYAIQSTDALALCAAFGPMTPRQAGAFRALAEYIHAVETTGTPDIDTWLPDVALTPSEQQDCIDEINQSEEVTHA